MIPPPAPASARQLSSSVQASIPRRVEVRRGCTGEYLLPTGMSLLSSLPHQPGSGDFSRALEYAEEATRVAGPPQAGAWYLRGVALASLGRFPDAVLSLKDGRCPRTAARRGLSTSWGTVSTTRRNWRLQSTRTIACLAINPAYASMVQPWGSTCRHG